MNEFRFLGAMCGALAAFAMVFAVAFWVTKGSAWMLAFFPALIGAPGSVIILSLRHLEL